MLDKKTESKYCHLAGNTYHNNSIKSARRSLTKQQNDSLQSCKTFVHMSYLTHGLMMLNQSFSGTVPICKVTMFVRVARIGVLENRIVKEY